LEIVCNHSGHVTLAPNANSERRPRLCAPLLQELQEKAEKQRKRLINTKSFPAGKLQGMRYPI
jgi:hypothetical protein